jgi:bacterioferritin-associated ferredoxin
MYVCLCVGVTTQSVADAVAVGATTSKQVATACGAGSECGRCRRTVRAIIDAKRAAAANAPDRDAGNR